MIRVHQQACKFIAVQLQAKQYAEAHIVNAAFHCPVHSFGVIVIIVLWSCGVQRQITFFVVGLLEQYVGADSGFF